jgi:hypothetical protein
MRGRCIHRPCIASGPNRPKGSARVRLDHRFELLKFVTTCLIAAALAMRASVPVGWMPNSTDQSHHAALIPCPMMDGMAMPKQPAQPQHPARHRLPPSHEGSICPFATAAQPVRAIIPHRIGSALAGFSSIGRVPTVLVAGWDHVPRAPPGQGNAITA